VGKMAITDRIDPITGEQFNVVYDNLDSKSAEKALNSIMYKFKKLLANNEKLTIELSTAQMRENSRNRQPRRKDQG
jgi:two-component SAPR family response regulator